MQDPEAGPGEEYLWESNSDRPFTKWTPNKPTSAWWYEQDQLADLIRAEVAEGRKSGRKKSIRQFIGSFAGLTSVIKQKTVFEAARLPGDDLEDLVGGSDL